MVTFWQPAQVFIRIRDELAGCWLNTLCFVLTNSSVLTMVPGQVRVLRVGVVEK